MGLCSSKRAPPSSTPDAVPVAEQADKEVLPVSEGTRNRSVSSPETRTTGTHRDTQGDFCSSISTQSRTSSNRNGSTTSVSMQRQSNFENEDKVPCSPSSEDGKSKRKYGRKTHSSKHLARHRDSLTLHARKVKMRATSDAAEPTKGLSYAKSFSGQSSSFTPNQSDVNPDTGEAGGTTKISSFFRAHTMPILPVKSVKKIHTVPADTQPSTSEGVTTEVEQKPTIRDSIVAGTEGVTQAEDSPPKTAWTASLGPVENVDSEA
eukprot:gb/GECG01002308.1/.p1 GENE.gb/GECG01002308.1/~~gb/GECG01002308.1/.p1  ORF type:complete len:263 (+),score=31.74 gb/GECG01002308.1/:1-789(+)